MAITQVRVLTSIIALLFGVFTGGSLAYSSQAPKPPCLSSGRPLDINNADVVKWKHSTANQFLARAHVQGVVGKVYRDRTGHKHFQILLDSHANETLEIIYNQNFGALPELSAGMNVEACGDYITSTGTSGGYARSPDGAILHWVHIAEARMLSFFLYLFAPQHESGFLEISDVVYGLR